MSINIWTDSMQHAALLGKPVLFTNWLIQRDIIPDGWYCYDLRGTHKSPSTRTTLVDHAADYHAGTVLSPIPLKHEGTASRRVNGTFYLLGEEMTLEQFCEEHDLAYTSSGEELLKAATSLYDRIVDKTLLARRLTLCANHLLDESSVPEDLPEQIDLFTDYSAKEKQKKEADTAHARERKLQETMLDIKKRFGKNAILKGLNLEDGATARERNNQIGGHKA